MDQHEPVSGKDKILVAMAAAMGGGCRTCARRLYSMADSAGATAEEIERAFLDGLVQRERATELMRQEASALLGRELALDPAMRVGAGARNSELGRLAASVALNAGPDALKRSAAARSSGATEAQLRVAIGIGRSVRGKAQDFSDAEIDESHAEAAGGDEPSPAAAAADCCTQGDTAQCS